MFDFIFEFMRDVFTCFIALLIGVLFIIFAVAMLSIPVGLSIKYSFWFILLYFITIPLLYAVIKSTDGFFL